MNPPTPSAYVCGPKFSKTTKYSDMQAQSKKRSTQAPSQKKIHTCFVSKHATTKQKTSHKFFLNTIVQHASGVVAWHASTKQKKTVHQFFLIEFLF